MPNPTRRRRKRLLIGLAIATTAVLGPTVTIVFCLGGLTTLAAYMDLHGFTAAMRVAAVGAVAVVVIPLACWIGVVLCDRIDRKTHRAQLDALRAPQAPHTKSSSPARHRKVA